jgi:hypothetical protein
LQRFFFVTVLPLCFASSVRRPGQW